MGTDITTVVHQTADLVAKFILFNLFPDSSNRREALAFGFCSKIPGQYVIRPSSSVFGLSES